MRDDVFVNPYNFIHFPKEKAKAYTDEDKHSGVIHYTVTTKTPLFIPNTSNNNAFGMNDKDHNSFDFFSYTDLTGKKVDNNTFYEPVIPGSEMRGVIRNVYETLTDSCMGLLNDVHPVKRIGAPFEPGLLMWENNTLSLVDAESFRIGQKYDDLKLDDRIRKCKEEFSDYKNGAKLYFRFPENKKEPIQEYDTKKKYKHEGYLIKWGFGVKKEHFHIYKDLGYGPVITYLDEDIKNVKKSIDDLIDSYLKQNPNEKAYQDYKDDFDYFMDRKDTSKLFFPINFNEEIENDIYLAPAIFSKEVSHKSLNKLAKEFAPCSPSTPLCPTCDLFGNILDKKSHASKIRFSDLQVKGKKENCKDYYEKIVTLSNLSSPKLGNVDFYLKKPDNATFWTYDYYIKNGEIKEWNGELRGRKYYWHHQNVILPQKIKPTNQNKTVRPVNKDVVFCGDLYFDRISKKQLNQLIYILNTAKEGLAYKLGMGKPLGLGSVSCKVDFVEERKISIDYDDKIIYCVEKQKDFNNLSYESVGFSEEVKREFKKISKFDAIPKDVEICYPKTESNNDKGFEWFQSNHKAKQIPKNRKKMEIQNSLPNILDEKITLPRKLKK